MFLLTVKSLNPFDLGKCHQVLAYAYECRGHDVTLWVYDPNQPRRDDITLHFNKADVSDRIVVQHNVAVKDDDGVSLQPVYRLARMDYTERTPVVQTKPRVTQLEVQTRSPHQRATRGVGVYFAPGRPLSTTRATCSGATDGGSGRDRSAPTTCSRRLRLAAP